MNVLGNRNTFGFVLLWSFLSFVSCNSRKQACWDLDNIVWDELVSHPIHAISDLSHAFSFMQMEDLGFNILMGKIFV